MTPLSENETETSKIYRKRSVAECVQNALERKEIPVDTGPAGL